MFNRIFAGLAGRAGEPERLIATEAVGRDDPLHGGAEHLAAAHMNQKVPETKATATRTARYRVTADQIRAAASTSMKVPQTSSGTPTPCSQD
ncbi:hypothetical protein [Roseomonas sp. WA12]